MFDLNEKSSNVKFKHLQRCVLMGVDFGDNFQSKFTTWRRGKSQMA